MNVLAGKNHGFSMIELIAVLVIISIASAVVVPRLVSNITKTGVVSQTAIIKSQLTYAQSLSMNSDSVWGVHCDGTYYWLFKNGSTSNKVILPGEDLDTVHLADKDISMTAFTVSFDIWGIPYTDASASTVQVGDEDITISSGSESKTITITQNTGLIL